MSEPYVPLGAHRGTMILEWRVSELARRATVLEGRVNDLSAEVTRLADENEALREQVVALAPGTLEMIDHRLAVLEAREERRRGTAP